MLLKNSIFKVFICYKRLCAEEKTAFLAKNSSVQRVSHVGSAFQFLAQLSPLASTDAPLIFLSPMTIGSPDRRTIRAHGLIVPHYPNAHARQACPRVRARVGRNPLFVDFFLREGRSRGGCLWSHSRRSAGVLPVAIRCRFLAGVIPGASLGAPLWGDDKEKRKSVR